MPRRMCFKEKVRTMFGTGKKATTMSPSIDELPQEHMRRVEEERSRLVAASTDRAVPPECVASTSKTAKGVYLLDVDNYFDSAVPNQCLSQVSSSHWSTKTPLSPIEKFYQTYIAPYDISTQCQGPTQQALERAERKHLWRNVSKDNTIDSLPSLSSEAECTSESISDAKGCAPTVLREMPVMSDSDRESTSDGLDRLVETGTISAGQSADGGKDSKDKSAQVSIAVDTAAETVDGRKVLEEYHILGQTVESTSAQSAQTEIKGCLRAYIGREAASQSTTEEGANCKAIIYLPESKVKVGTIERSSADVHHSVTNTGYEDELKGTRVYLEGNGTILKISAGTVHISFGGDSTYIKMFGDSDAVHMFSKFEERCGETGIILRKACQESECNSVDHDAMLIPHEIYPPSVTEKAQRYSYDRVETKEVSRNRMEDSDTLSKDSDVRLKNDIIIPQDTQVIPDKQAARQESCAPLPVCDTSSRVQGTQNIGRHEVKLPSQERGAFMADDLQAKMKTISAEQVNFGIDGDLQVTEDPLVIQGENIHIQDMDELTSQDVYLSIYRQHYLQKQGRNTNTGRIQEEIADQDQGHNGAECIVEKNASKEIVSEDSSTLKDKTMVDVDGNVNVVQEDGGSLRENSSEDLDIPPSDGVDGYQENDREVPEPCMNAESAVNQKTIPPAASDDNDENADNRDDDGDAEGMIDECGLVDVYKLKQEINSETSKLQKSFSKYRSRTQKIERLQKYLDQLKKERDEMVRLLESVNKQTVAMRNEAAEMRCTVTAVCDVSVANIGKETEARRLEPACYRRYLNIRTAADAGNALTAVRNRIKALNDLEVLIYRKQLILHHVLPNVTQEKTSRRSVRPVNKGLKSKRAEQSTSGQVSAGNIVIEVVSPVADPNTPSWSDEVSHTESPLTISTPLSVSNDVTASVQHLPDTEV